MYISLHNHSHYSTLDGYQTVPEMVSRAKELGYHSLALTDHGTMRGVIDFYEECHKQEIKPIIGCEFYFCETPEIRDRSLTYHLVLLAKNDIGYHNIKLLDSESYKEDNFFFNGRLPLDYLREHSEGLICLTACMAGVLNSDKADWWMQTLKEIFPENLYAEIQPLNIPEQQEYNAKVIGLARKYEVPLVVTTDAHYAIKADKEYHSLWTGIKGVQYHDDENYLWSKQEIMETAWIPDNVKDECIANTEEIAKQCNVTIEMGGNHYPDYPVANPANKIREICRGTWKDKVPKGKYKEYAERFESEMVDLEKAGYLNYLLVIWDMLKHCIENGIPVGEGRGSASGSLVGYLMDIHKVDPIVRGTEFFRFCNPYRVSPCDIDTDVSTVYRGKIIDYVKERYGYICKIMTIGYTKNPEKHEVGKAAVQRAGQALKLEAQALKRLVKGIELDMNEILMSTEFDKETRERLYDVAQHFSYRLHKIGIHASAILVTPDEIENYTPLEGCYSTDVSTGERKYIQAAAYTYHQLEAMGCLKLDILGLGTLDVIDECLQSTGMTMADIPLDDKETYKTYADGNLLGVFQMESSGMTRTAQQLGVSNFNDIAALVALFRPGPIYSGMLQQYIDGKNGKEIEYPCEVVKKLTENTYGVLVYQEQVMKIAMEMAGYTLGQADVLRKVIGRKEVTKIDKAVEEFIMACKEQGYDESIAKPVAEQIRAAGAYIFNKCLSGREYIFRQNAGKEALSIGEMYKICHDKDFAIATGHKPLHGKYRQFGYGKAYSMVGDGIIQNDIIDIRYSGKLPVYVVTTESGKQVRCTMNHKLPTPNGIKLLEELGVGDLLYVDGGYNTKASDYLFYKEKQAVNSMKGHRGFALRPNGGYVSFRNSVEFSKGMLVPCYDCGKPYKPNRKFEMHHVNHDRTDNSNENLVWLCNSCHKKRHYSDGRTKKGTKPRLIGTEKIVSIKYECTEDCYDVEMKAPNHNFVVGSGIVVCNSHSVGYAQLSYKSAYLKTHYPVPYMCALINSKSKQEDVQKYIPELNRLAIQLLPPDYSIGNLKWQVEGKAIRIGLNYIKGVGKALKLGATTWEQFITMNNKTVCTALIKAGAMDFLGKDRGWMLANLEDNAKKLAYMEKCKERIEFYTEQGKASGVAMWKKKLADTVMLNDSGKGYDVAKGEMEVLRLTFHTVPKILVGIASAVQEFEDKNKKVMARVIFDTDYGEYKCVVFASQWKQETRRGRYGKIIRGITIEYGKTYEFIQKDGVISDCREYRCKYKQV